MKKLITLLIVLLFNYISFGQNETRELSNYEKYLLQKEQAAIPDTIVKYDTVYVEQKKAEFDDIYYRPSQDDLDLRKQELKLKQKELRLEKKELRKFQDSLYFDAKQEVYNDLYYTSLIYRFHRPYYSPYYYSWYWSYDPFFYDPWYYDSW